MNAVPARSRIPESEISSCNMRAKAILNKKHWKLAGPALLTFGVSLLLVAGVIFLSGGDPLTLARLGTRYSEGDLQGTQGYDGQFVYYIARDWNPTTVSGFLDVPAYRYQRILLPALAHIFSGGNPALIPWGLAILGVISHTLGTWVVTILLVRWKINPWYALVYGLWVVFWGAIRLDLPEPLAYALVAAALLSIENEHHRRGWVFYGLAIFAKEVTLIFVAAQGLVYLLRKEWLRATGLAIVAVFPFLLFQLWLWQVFGVPGIGSGGAMATPFERIPLMGLWKIGEYSMVYLLAMSIVFIPSLVAPALWGIWLAVKQLHQRSSDALTFALGLQAIVLLFLPFSTFREPGGVVRYACGLVLAVLLLTARDRHQRILRYTPLWIVLYVFLLKG